ncbi:thioesterase II family protein [Kitasatospora sp. NPDC051170]|uniref:thioesterase II family protein n=1 Tax=Kitasatospora sp. NPDC051170 TaxID=3364056 RepID=UPI0037AFFB27
MNPDRWNSTRARLWLRSFDVQGGGVPRLVCFPHAGGSAAFYAPLAAALGPGVPVLAVQYPGRQDRRREPGIDNVPELADAILDVLAEEPEAPVALFGHSLGAVLAFEVAVRMERRLGVSPTTLFVSGRRAPTRHRVESVHTRDDAGLVAELLALGGTPDHMLRDPDVLEMILPMVRSDYRAVETYRGRPGDVVGCPTVVLSGSDDPAGTPEEVASWQLHCRGPYSQRAFVGGHFFLQEHWPAVAGLIRSELAVVRR